MGNAKARTSRRVTRDAQSTSPGRHAAKSVLWETAMNRGARSGPTATSNILYSGPQIDSGTVSDTFLAELFQNRDSDPCQSLSRRDSSPRRMTSEWTQKPPGTSKRCMSACPRVPGLAGLPPDRDEETKWPGSVQKNGKENHMSDDK